MNEQDKIKKIRELTTKLERASGQFAKHLTELEKRFNRIYKDLRLLVDKAKAEKIRQDLRKKD